MGRKMLLTRFLYVAVSLIARFSFGGHCRNQTTLENVKKNYRIVVFSTLWKQCFLPVEAFFWLLWILYCYESRQSRLSCKPFHSRFKLQQLLFVTIFTPELHSRETQESGRHQASVGWYTTSLGKTETI